MVFEWQELAVEVSLLQKIPNEQNRWENKDKTDS